MVSSESFVSPVAVSHAGRKAVCRVLDTMASKMDSVRVLHQCKSFLDRPNGRLEEGSLCRWSVLDYCFGVFQLGMHAGKLGLAVRRWMRKARRRRSPVTTRGGVRVSFGWCHSGRMTRRRNRIFGVQDPKTETHRGQPHR